MLPGVNGHLGMLCPGWPDPAAGLRAGSELLRQLQAVAFVRAPAGTLPPGLGCGAAPKPPPSPPGRTS
jgi:hypothetical protein